MTAGRGKRRSPDDRRPIASAVLLPALLILATLTAYYPAWHGGVLWDDDRHITSPALQSLGGLWRIWFDLGATQQYYPLSHSAFWLLHRLAGDHTTVYHVATIVLHGWSAFLVVCILRQLRIRGAVLAGALFALHPVQVESVAWMTELKNTLSGTLCFASALAWVRFDDSRTRASYVACVALFVLALLSKTVTAMLPVSLVILVWWRRGTVEWRRDIRPLVPMLVLGAAGGLLTAWVERTIIRAQGSEYDLSIIERCLVAARAAWFYLATLAWPHPLIFVYPRWEVSDRAWPQYLPLLGALAAFGALWTFRRRSRAPLSAFAMFVVLLFPALGFLNVYPFRFSYVADHFQYLASVPVFALAAAGVARLAASRGLSARMAAAVAVVVLVVPCAVLTFAQSRDYATADALYRSTLRRNPAAWLAAVNLGVLELERDPRTAALQFRDAIRLKPDLPEAHSDLGNALQRLGDFDGAVAEYREALRLNPEQAEARNNLANALYRLGRLDESAREAAEAVRLAPDNADAQFNLGVSLYALGRQEALNHFAAAARLRPDLAEAHNYLGIILQKMGHGDEALLQYGEAVRLRPGWAEARNNLGGMLLTAGRTEDAAREFREAVRLQPTYADARFNLANVLQAQGQLDEAIVQYQAALSVNPRDAAAHNNLGAALEAAGRLQEAAKEYRTALTLDPASTTARANAARLSR